MAMVEMFEPEPETETLTLGFVEVLFEGPSLKDLGADLAELIAREVAANINERLSGAISSNAGFSTSGYDVSIETITLEFDSVFEGSVVGKYALVATVVFGTYGAIATYPQFKEGLGVLTEDIGSAVEYVIQHKPEPIEDRPDPTRYQVYFRDEKELVLDISDKVRK